MWPDVNGVLLKFCAGSSHCSLLLCLEPLDYVVASEALGSLGSFRRSLHRLLAFLLTLRMSMCGDDLRISHILPLICTVANFYNLFDVVDLQVFLGFGESD